ncbi:MAG: stage III sporulation protein AE, partial [Clostridiales bacterium]
ISTSNLSSNESPQNPNFNLPQSQNPSQNPTTEPWEDGDFNAAIENLDNSLNQEYENFSLKSLYEKFKEEKTFSLTGVPHFLWGYFIKELSIFAKLLVQVLFLGILAGVFAAMSNEDNGISAMGHWVILLSFTLIATRCFGQALNLAMDTISQASDFLYGLIPLLLGFLASLGSVTSLAVVEPALLMMITLFLGIMERFFLPLTVILAALVIVGQLSPKYSFSQLQKLIKDIILMGLTFLLTVFTGVLSLMSLGAGAIDGVALKTMKLAAGNFIPIVGRHVSDALDSLLGASLLMKNTMGIFGVIAIAIVIILPAVKILIMSLLFRGVGAMLEPLGAKEFGIIVQNFAGVLTVVFALVIGTGLLFFFFVFILVGLGNLTVMFR